MWKDINGWDEYYEVNENGDVRNKLNNKCIIGDTNSAGYPRVCLYNKDHIPSKQRFFRHRLVAEHFIPNPDNLPEVNHKDSNKTNPCANNLEWSSREDNELHSRICGDGEYKPFAVEFENGEIELFSSASELAMMINVTKGTIYHWLKKRNNGYLNHGIRRISYI